MAAFSVEVSVEVSVEMSVEIKFQQKIFAMYGDLDKMTKVYHSDMDDILQIREKYLLEAVALLGRSFD
ncbi:MAG: hypothetical protein L7H18_00325 [Candidatus Nealsonbacteria bacterium DGGOD1a]|nr:MAG: hypothetical protein L7H18_00325 [Candidatus Nealsonbacteria bacterium DGGOD1a]